MSRVAGSSVIVVSRSAAARAASQSRSARRVSSAANRAALAERNKQPIELSALSLGNIHVVHLPGECMIEFQRFAQQARPEDFVAVAAYGDLGPGYICTARSYGEGGYEPSASNSGPGTEARVKTAIRTLLGQ